MKILEQMACVKDVATCETNQSLHFPFREGLVALRAVAGLCGAVIVRRLL